VEDVRVWGAPDGDLTSPQIPPAEGIVYRSTMSGFGDRPFPMIGVILVLDDVDLAAIAAGTRHILLSWHGHQMPVFVVPSLIDGGEGDHR